MDKLGGEEMEIKEAKWCDHTEAQVIRAIGTPGFIVLTPKVVVAIDEGCVKVICRNCWVKSSSSVLRHQFATQ